MEPIWILIAFILGFAATRVELPPLVGYLVAGFVLNAMGAEGGHAIERIADLGVLLLLFSIGLKLKFKSLFRPEIWAGATLHLLLSVVGFGVLIGGLSAASLFAFADLDMGTALLIAFACSFSSTVFAVKILEERGEMTSLHGRVAIGILIMQDIFAVLFLTFSTGKLPSVWALAVVPGLVVLRPILMATLDRVGHRELLLLFGVFMVVGLGAGGFDLVGLKPDLGALVFGVLVSSHPKADELSKALLSFKDLFLVGFFLNIGLSGLPTLASLGIAILLLALLVPKAALYFMVLTRFRLRVRTAFLTALSLFNYSEFGLIVAAIGVKSGWIDAEWSVTIAIALSISFVAAAALNKAPHTLYARHSNALKRFETAERLPGDTPISTGDAEVVIFGMGRVGAGAYDYMRRHYGGKVLGIDHDAATVAANLAADRRVIHNDATDSEFWANIQPSGKIKLVMLAMPQHTANLFALRRIVNSDYGGKIAATARYDDEMKELEDGGAHLVFNFFAEAGAGFAEEVQRVMVS
ncbi:MAG: cation:proton antiporter [Desulfobacterales bacterium]